MVTALNVEVICCFLRLYFYVQTPVSFLYVFLYDKVTGARKNQLDAYNLNIIIKIGKWQI